MNDVIYRNYDSFLTTQQYYCFLFLAHELIMAFFHPKSSMGTWSVE